MRRLLVLVVAAAGVLGSVLSRRVLRRYVVQGRSMLRAYEPGQRLLVERATYRLRPPRITDVVVVRWPHSLVRPAGSPELDLKRIAAGPGGRVSVRGVEQVLGEDEWFLLGDNLDQSTDSRELGPVTTRDIVGRVWFRY